MLIFRIFTYFSFPLYRHFKRRGVLVLLWVLNTEEDFKYAIDLECTGIITDSPSLLKQFLIRKGLYLNSSYILN